MSRSPATFVASALPRLRAWRDEADKLDVAVYAATASRARLIEEIPGDCLGYRTSFRGLVSDGRRFYYALIDTRPPGDPSQRCGAGRGCRWELASGRVKQIVGNQGLPVPGLPAAALIAGAPWMGLWTLLPLALAALLFRAADIGIDRAARPELPLFAAWTASQLIIAASVALTGGPESVAMSWLVLPLITLGARFSERGMAFGVAITLALMIGVAFGVDSATGCGCCRSAAGCRVARRSRRIRAFSHRHAACRPTLSSTTAVVPSSSSRSTENDDSSAPTVIRSTATGRRFSGSK